MNATPAVIKVTISQARASFSKWVNQASGGMKGKIAIPDDFDASLPDDLLNAFEA
ncbi:DUF2281 domain-containing protein [Pseudomonas sp. WS 5106]|uniref:DUF2281 domain-containing protein n=1 Tax=Pseudomonas cremoris TaxID=2724178 RepID=A0A7X1AT37_9PSED|nr:hypothetical protein [Pseudomonas cremoris]MBC2384764.1 DUF2281 domain-containing protein [Pseudomonas cremoris]MBC2410248.1 DUF2281 domain-containing protein [Pseudomonas cremoris]